MTTFIKTLGIPYLENEPLAKHTSFRVGGPAEIFMRPETKADLAKIWQGCKAHAYPLTILGDGTNVLVADKGLTGIVVSTNKMNYVELLPDGYILAAAGARLSKVAEVACKAGLQGFEFASGIPGTVGGAVYMNAGAYDYDIGQFCTEVTLLADDIVKKTNADMKFGYRSSIAHDGNMLILEARFRLAPGHEPEEIRKKMQELNARRRQSQPLDFPSAGSTFKRPEGYFAGKLIQDAGLKGFAIGGAQVSEKHAGFVINTGGATAQDIFDLMAAVREKVYAHAGVWLEPEVRQLGF